MKTPTILLVNPNLMSPPIAPLGLEYVAESLTRHGYHPVLCDLAFSEDWQHDLRNAIEAVAPAAVAISVRNIDDAFFLSQDFVLATTAEVIAHAGAITDAPVILGGVGFSAAPKEILRYTGARHGVAGEGEEALPQLLDCLAAGDDVSRVAGAVYRRNGEDVAAIPRAFVDLADMRAPSRGFLDNRRYFDTGGQAGIETKRGCNRPCVYCVDPLAKGSAIRLRSPESVVDEFRNLLEQGIGVVHLCDSEFNLPREHALAVSNALTASGLGSEVRWYAYASPRPFDSELASAMADAGCVGINFGVDHGDEIMLGKLGRDYGPADVLATCQACRDANLAVMFDMILGSPGETRETLARAVDLMRRARPDRVGLSCGVRVYPHTPLARKVLGQGPIRSNPNLHGSLEENEDLLRPIFFVDKELGLGIHGIVSELVDGDEMFLHTDPSQREGNYNYNDNSVLEEAIRSGERGAYWDILRRIG